MEELLARVYPEVQCVENLGIQHLRALVRVSLLSGLLLWHSWLQGRVANLIKLFVLVLCGDFFLNDEVNWIFQSHLLLPDLFQCAFNICI